MPPFRELSPAQKRNEIVRWLLLLPGAWLVSEVAHRLIGAVLRAIPRGDGAQGIAAVLFWVRTGPYYALPQMLLVVTGAWIAPRQQVLVAWLMMLVAGMLSLLKHVVGQWLVRNTIGPVNYAHFGLEMAGLLAGVVCVHRWITAAKSTPPR